MGPDKYPDSPEIARSKRAVDKAHNEQQKLVLLRERTRELGEHHAELQSVCRKLQAQSERLGKKMSRSTRSRG